MKGKLTSVANIIPDRLLTMSQLRVALGMEGKRTSLLVARLHAISAERPDHPLRLFKAGRQWVVTESSFRATLPELYADHDTSLRGVVERQADEIQSLRARLTAIENRLWASNLKRAS